jgi:hypothetical protein
MSVADQPPVIQCAVQQDRAGDRLRLRGRLVSSRDATGTYSLRIVKTSPAGSSNIKMGGKFSAAANVETFVGLANFNVETGATYETDFSLTVGQRTYACQSRGGDSK